MIKSFVQTIRARWRERFASVKASAEFWRLAGALVAALGVALSDRKISADELDGLRALAQELLREINKPAEEK